MGIQNINDPRVRDLLLKGNFGLEKESLRVTPQGKLSHTEDPFPRCPTITRDFCENQTEINTPVHSSLLDAYEDLFENTKHIQRTLAELKPEPELLWPFSNPPYIKNEADIPIAQFKGEEAVKTEYREYLSDRYGRYIMTYCGIHYNFSFADELLAADYQLLAEQKREAGGGILSFEDYKTQLYLDLTEKSVAYSWIVTAITAASPLTDGTFVEKGANDQVSFAGMASMRASELGYWNFFSPVLNYSSVESYAESIKRYVESGWIKYPSELYYPVRLKPRGAYDVDALKHGVSHIELRMIDLNPLREAGVDLRDLAFCHLFLVWLACIPPISFTDVDQIQATQNFKNAARYDLETVKIVAPDGRVCSVAQAARNSISMMRDFYDGLGMLDAEEAGFTIGQIIDYQYQKFIDPENRYAWQIRKQFQDDFVQQGLKLSAAYQQKAIESS
ncbi:MAG: hypothetical protein ACI4B9_04065 [Eggerthellaceae bacterium]